MPLTALNSDENGEDIRTQVVKPGKTSLNLFKVNVHPDFTREHSLQLPLC